MRRVLIATSNAGKLRDFAAAAGAHLIEIAPLPDYGKLPEVEEDGATFDANARKIPPQAVDKVAASIQEFGWRQPAVSDRGRQDVHDPVVSGHGVCT